MNKLVHPSDPVYRQAAEFDFAEPPMNAVQLVAELMEQMKFSDGIGLAAPQIGLSHRVFVMSVGELSVDCFNPIILEESEEKEIDSEGCLSFPEIRLPIERSKWVKTEYYDCFGKKVQQTFEGLAARCFAHEREHLDGLVFLLKASKLRRDMAMKVLKKNGYRGISQRILTKFVDSNASSMA